MTVDVHPEPTHKQMEDRARCTKRDGMVVQEVIDNLVISLLYAYIVIMKATTEPLVIEYIFYKTASFCRLSTKSIWLNFYRFYMVVWPSNLSNGFRQPGYQVKSIYLKCRSDLHFSEYYLNWIADCCALIWKPFINWRPTKTASNRPN